MSRKSDIQTTTNNVKRLIETNSICYNIKENDVQEYNTFTLVDEYGDEYVVTIKKVNKVVDLGGFGE